MKRPEQHLQRQCVGLLDHCRKAGILEYFHVPNGGKRTRVEAAILVGQGVRAGVPDLVILPTAGVAMFAELKATKGKLSDAQEYWRDRLREHEYPWALIRSVEDMAAFLVDNDINATVVAEYEAPAWAR